MQQNQRGLAVTLAVGLLLQKPHVNIVATVIGLVALLDKLLGGVKIALLGLLHGIDVHALGGTDVADDLEAGHLQFVHIVHAEHLAHHADAVVDDAGSVHAAVVDHVDDLDRETTGGLLLKIALGVADLRAR